MRPATISAFDLSEHLAPKADPALIAADEQHFAAIAATLEQTLADLSQRLEAELTAPGGTGQAAMDRDEEVHRLTARIHTLSRFGLDLCLGHMVRASDPEPPQPIVNVMRSRPVRAHLWVWTGRVIGAAPWP